MQTAIARSFETSARTQKTRVDHAADGSLERLAELDAEKHQPATICAHKYAQVEHKQQIIGQHLSAHRGMREMDVRRAQAAAAIGEAVASKHATGIQRAGARTSIGSHAKQIHTLTKLNSLNVLPGCTSVSPVRPPTACVARGA